MDKISDRDRTKIRMAVADKLVDKVCDALIEGKPLTGNLRETLGNTMTNVLNEPENKSKITQVEFYFDKGKGSIAISCYDWSKKITNELGWTDNLSVEIYLEEFANFLREQS